MMCSVETLKQFPCVMNPARKVRDSIKRGTVRCVVHWVFAGHLLRWWRIRKWLAKTGGKYLQVGGGRHLKAGGGWLNGDLIAGEIYLDATKTLPFPDNSLDVIWTEQFIEHLSQQDGTKFLYEAFRVLKKGGMLRQATPDLNKLVALYRDENPLVPLSDAVARHMRNHRKNSAFAKPTACQLLNDMFRLWGHQFIYDQESLKRMTEEAGFSDFRWTRFGESDSDVLIGLERHADEEWMKNGLVMVYEAKK